MAFAANKHTLDSDERNYTMMQAFEWVSAQWSCAGLSLLSDVSTDLS